MNCPKCGRANDKNQKFCGECGAQLEDSDFQGIDTTVPLSPRKSKKVLIIGGLIVVVLGLCIVSSLLLGGYYYFKNSGTVKGDNNFYGEWVNASPTSLEDCPGDIVVTGGKIGYSKGAVSIKVIKTQPASGVAVLKLEGNDCFTQGEYRGKYVLLNWRDDSLYISWFRTEKEALSTLDSIQRGGNWHYDGMWEKKR